MLLGARLSVAAAPARHRTACGAWFVQAQFLLQIYKHEGLGFKP